MTIFYCLRFETFPTCRATSRIYVPQEQGHPVIPQSTGIPFRCLLRLAGLRWRYSNPPSQGVELVCSVLFCSVLFCSILFSSLLFCSLLSELCFVASDCSANNMSARTTKKMPFFCCCFGDRCRGNAFTEPLLRNGLHNPVVLLLRACILPELVSNGRYL
jgi:hypothetical protein